MPRLIGLCLLLCHLFGVLAPARAETLPDTPAAATPAAREQPHHAPAQASTVAAASPDAPPSDASPLERDLQAADFRLGAPAFIRVFKAESRLEVWLMRGPRFALFRTYEICKWSGELGPKLQEGDRQSPEGIYAITAGDLLINARWHRAMNVGFPNARDIALGLTGSGILIHGKCTSIGCFALTDARVEEVYTIVEAALAAGQTRVPVHIFPFALTRAKLARAAGSEWSDFWRELKRGHDLFLRDGLPPRAFVCAGGYAFQSRRARPVRLTRDGACAPLTRPARPGALRMVSLDRAGLSRSLPEPARCDPRERRCRLVKAALLSPVPCPRKYGRCRDARLAAVKSVDCPLKYPRCRKQAGGAQKPAIATLKAPRKPR